MSELANKFGIPQSLLDVAKKTFDESTEYQNKVKAHMAKKGIKSLGDLSPEEKKKFFNDLDAAHKAKNEEVKQGVAKEVEITEYKQFMRKDMDDLATIRFNNPKLALSKFEPVTSSAGKRAFNGFKVTHEITVGGSYGPAYDLAVLKKGEKYYGAFGSKIASNEFSSSEDAANWALKMYNWMRKSANAAEYLSDKVKFIKEDTEIVEQKSAKSGVIDESDAYDKDRYAVKNGKAVKDNPSHAGSANSKDQPHHVWASNEKDVLDKMKKKNVKEEVEQTDEAIVKGKGYDNPDNARKAPEGKVPMTSLHPGHNDKAARLAAVQAKGKLVKGKAQSAPQKEDYELTQEDIEFINSLNERK